MILRPPWSVWHGGTRKCIPFSGISGVGPKIGQSVVLGSLMCFPHGLRNMGMIRLGCWFSISMSVELLTFSPRAYTKLGGV